MGKKLGLGLLIAFLIAAGGGLVYWRMAGHAAGRFPLAIRRVAPTPSERTGGPAAAAPPAVSSTAPREATEKKGKGPSEAVFSPRVDESLEYAASLAQLNSTIANLKIAVAGRQTLAGKSSWHLQGFAHTENPYRMVFELDDQFDSYSEAENLTSLQYELHLSERGQKADMVLRLLPSEKDPAPPGMAAARVPPGTRDPLGMLEYLRGIDGVKTREVRCPVYDGRKLYDVHATVVNKAERVSVPAGNYTTTKIEIRVYESGVEMKDAHFLLYVANDAARTPVLMEAVLPVATVRVELMKAK